MSSATVSALSVTPVKATRLHTVESVELGTTGARNDRRFFVIDDRGRMVNSKRLGLLQTVVASFDEDARQLSLRFPDGRVVEDVVDGSEPIQARFYSEDREVRLLDGPWSEALSAHTGQSLRVVEAGGAVDRGAEGAATLISRGSLERLASEAGVDGVDARRFRMLIEIDGVAAHEEDGWVGQPVGVGAAVIRFEGHVGRCLTTSRQPDTGEVDLPTLDVLRDYRVGVDTTEPLPFGVYGRVLQPGIISVGDPVRVGVE